MKNIEITHKRDYLNEFIRNTLGNIFKTQSIFFLSEVFFLASELNVAIKNQCKTFHILIVMETHE